MDRINVPAAQEYRVIIDPHNDDDPPRIETRRLIDFRYGIFTDQQRQQVMYWVVNVDTIALSQIALVDEDGQVVQIADGNKLAHLVRDKLSVELMGECGCNVIIQDVF